MSGVRISPLSPDIEHKMEDQLRSKIREYVFSELSEYFKLDENSPSGLVRIKNRVGRNINMYNIGTRDFSKNGKPLAWVLKFQGNKYHIHRIIWVLIYGSIDSSLVIDHLDGDPFNNTIDNLRLKTNAENRRNSCKSANNTTGTTGVYLMNDGKGHCYYTAQWQETDGSRNCKCFSFNKFGEENAKTMAINYRLAQLERLISEGANYTERHGL